jgi:hypothetical protein
MLTVARSPICCSISRFACCEKAFFMLRSIVVSLTRAVEGNTESRMLGNAGAPDCVGASAIAVCCSWLRSVVFRADINALASARSGTRSKKIPAPPRTIGFRESNGDQAKPRRGEKLFVSVEIVSRNCRS